MKPTPSLIRLWLLPLLAVPAAASAQDSLNFPHLGEIIRLDPALDALLPKEAVIEVLASGFDWTEGPVWVQDSEGGHLLFSDIPPNSVMKWKEGVGASLFLKPSGYTGVADYGAEPGCNGLLLDAKGQLVSCEHGDRRLSVLTAGGGKRTLVDNYEGKRLNSPNDATFKANGDLYFTDPPYGLPTALGGSRPGARLLRRLPARRGRQADAAHQGNDPPERHRASRPTRRRSTSRNPIRRPRSGWRFR